MSQAELVLYTRPDCHLCEVAAALLDRQKLNWRAENIELDLDLIRRYGTRVPVVFRPEDRAELPWPFSEEALRSFVDDGH